MRWGQVVLGDIADFSNGVNFDKTAYAPGVKLVGVSNFGDRFTPDYSELVEVKNESVRQNDYLEKGDIIFVRSNGNKELVGRCMLIKELPRPTTFSGFCIRARIRDKRRHDPKFWTYHFKSAAFRKAISGSAIGANIQNLSQSRLASYQAIIPDVETQIRIANTLSAYDDLIENNQKQIKLLEEVAQRLYKEWFVDLRFPGYEHTPVVDGVPEGWGKVLLKELVDVKYGKDHKKIENGGIPVYGSGGLMRKCAKSLYQGESVLIPRKGSLNNIMYVDEAFWTVDTMFYTQMKCEHIGIYTYFFLKSLDMYSMNIGAAVPSMTTSILDALEVMRPSDAVLETFDAFAKNAFDRIAILRKQIDKTQMARDSMLPKLMSGEIEV